MIWINPPGPLLKHKDKKRSPQVPLIVDIKLICYIQQLLNHHTSSVKIRKGSFLIFGNITLLQIVASN
jgi:hypothetical protein